MSALARWGSVVWGAAGLGGFIALAALFWARSAWPGVVVVGLGLAARAYDAWIKSALAEDDLAVRLDALDLKASELAKDVASLKTGARLSGGLR